VNAETQINSRRFLLYGFWLVSSIVLFWEPCVTLVRFSLANDDASHVILIPLLSACLIYMEQKKIFRIVSLDYPLAGLLLMVSVVAYFWTFRSAASWTPTDALAGYTFALALFWISGFVLIFGREAFRNARFSLLFLFLTVPLPDALLNRSIYFLQRGSADVTEMIFDLVRVPALREGFVFHLAHVNIEVARECSGIRSSMALLILALIFGHLLLHTLWKQVVLVVAGLLIMLVKNGVRIATLTILAQYVDPGFLYGRLHREGGVVFFLLGLILLLPVLWLLQRGEKRVATFENPSVT
jgi:exosortase